MRGVLCGPRELNTSKDGKGGSEGKGGGGGGGGGKAASPSPPLPPPEVPLPPSDSQSSTSSEKQSSKNARQTTVNKKDSDREKFDQNRNSHNTSDTGFSVTKKESRKSSKYTGFSDIKGRGYHTFYGLRKRGGQSHLRTTYRKRSGYKTGHRRKLDSTFDVYGNSNSFDRQKVYDVFDENSNIREHRRRSETGSYVKDSRRLDLGQENFSDENSEGMEVEESATNTDKAKSTSSERSTDKRFAQQATEG
ncbi:unnamed protein product [Trichobilharzia szidati]|nr:unnamed protein product [Trichobilharzia szidati]